MLHYVDIVSWPGVLHGPSIIERHMGYILFQSFLALGTSLLFFFLLIALDDFGAMVCFLTGACGVKSDKMDGGGKCPKPYGYLLAIARTQYGHSL